MFNYNESSEVSSFITFLAFQTRLKEDCPEGRGGGGSVTQEDAVVVSSE